MHVGFFFIARKDVVSQRVRRIQPVIRYRLPAAIRGNMTFRAPPKVVFQAFESNGVADDSTEDA